MPICLHGKTNFHLPVAASTYWATCETDHLPDSEELCVPCTKSWSYMEKKNVNC